MTPSDLPDTAIVHILAFEPSLTDARAAGQVCRQWRRAAAAPSAVWSNMECTCTSLDGWMALMRFLRPRMPAVSCLRVRIATMEGDCRKQRILSRCHAAVATLASRLSAAPRLQELDLCWEVAFSVGGRPTGIRLRSWPWEHSGTLVLAHDLDLQALLAATSRRAGGALPLPLRRLHLTGVPNSFSLAPALSRLPKLESLVIGRPHRLWGSRMAPLPPGKLRMCLLPSLSSLTLHMGYFIVVLAACEGLAAALPALRELRMAVPLAEGQVLDEAPVRALLAALSPLAGQLEVLELPPGCLPLSVSACTNLHTLVVRRPSPSLAAHLDVVLPQLRRDQASWGPIALWLLNGASPFHPACRRLRALDAELRLEGTEPLQLEALPLSMRNLSLRFSPGCDCPLPAGQFLWRIEQLSLDVWPMLRLTPLLDFMPALTRLTAHPAPRSDGPSAPSGASGGFGDAALDAAAAEAAALDLSGHRQQWAAAGALAARLARSRRFEVLVLEVAVEGNPLKDGHAVLMHVGHAMQRASSRVEVVVAMPAEPRAEPRLCNMP